MKRKEGAGIGGKIEGRGRRRGKLEIGGREEGGILKERVGEGDCERGGRWETEGRVERETEGGEDERETEGEERANEGEGRRRLRVMGRGQVIRGRGERKTEGEWRRRRLREGGEERGGRLRREGGEGV